MDKLFNKTPASNFAALALAGIMASGYMIYTAGKPVVMALAGGKVAGVKMAAIVKPDTQGPIQGSTFGSPKAESLNSIQQQADKVVNKVEQLAQANQTKNDKVLGDETESVPVREEFPPAVNLLRNSSFEEDSNLAPRQWNYQYDSNSGNSFTTAEAIRTGTKGLKFVGGGTGNYGISQPATKLIEHRAYALTLWVKPVNTDAHTVKLSFWDEVNNKEAASKTFSFSGTKEWNRLVLQVSNKNNWSGKKWFPMVTVNGLGAGALYIDDAQLEEASSYTPYHFVGGGSTQSHVSVLGDGSVEIDVHGNIYPAVSGVGGLGTGSNKFSELRLTKATIDNNGSLSLDGDITVNGNGTFKGAMAFDGTIKSNLIPDLDSTYDLGSTSKKWRVGYINSLYLQNAETIGNSTNGDIDFTDSATSNNLVMDLNAAADAVELRNDTEDLRLRAAGNGNLVMRAGDGATNSNVDGNDLFMAAEDAMTLRAATYSLQTSGSTITMTALNSGITMSTGSSTQGSVVVRSAGSMILDTSANSTGVWVNAGSTLNLNALGGDATITVTNSNAVSEDFILRVSDDATASTANGQDIFMAAVDDLILFGDNYTLTATNGVNYNVSGADMALEVNGDNDYVLRAGDAAAQSVANGNDIELVAEDALILTGSSLTVTTSGGDNLFEVNGDADFIVRAGDAAREVVANNNDIQLAAEDSMIFDAGDFTLAVSEDAVAALTLNASRGGILLSSSNASGNGNMTLKSGGTLSLQTSSTNSGVDILAGTGALTTNTGTVAMTTTNGDIVVTAGATNADTEDFVLRVSEDATASTANGRDIFLAAVDDLILFGDNYTLTATNGVNYNVSGADMAAEVNGDNDFIVRAGDAAAESLANNNDIFLAAEADVIVRGATWNLTTSGGDQVFEADGDQDFIVRAGDAAREIAANNNDIQLSAEADMLLDAATFTLATSNGDIVINSLAANADTEDFSLRVGDDATASTANGRDIFLAAVDDLILYGDNYSVTVSNGVNYEVNGAKDFVLRVGDGAREVAANGNDIQLSAVDAFLADSGSFTMATSNGDQAFEVNGDNDFVLRVGDAAAQSVANGNDVEIVAEDVAYLTSAALTVTTSTGDAQFEINGDADFVVRAGDAAREVAANNNDIQLAAEADVIVDGATFTLNTSNAAVGSLALNTTRGGITMSTGSDASGNSEIIIKSAGTLRLDTSSANSAVLMRTGTGTLDISSGLVQARAANDSLTAIRLLADRGGIEISSGTASGNGNVTIKSAGTLTLDTSANNSNIMVRAGTGRIDLSGNTILVNSGAGTLDLSANNTISIVSSTTARVWGETGTLVGRAGTATRVHGRLCIEGSGDGSTCPAGDDGRLFVNTTGETAGDDSGDVFDLAEYYPASEPVDPGTVVIADSNSRATVKMSQYAYQRVLGVVSTTPAIRINEGSFSVGGTAITEASVKPLIALVGRVPVKVSNENGAIRVGDRLVASTKAGYAMKATKQGMTLGMALEDMSFENGATEAKVMTFVNVSWYFPEVVEELEREHQLANAVGLVPDPQKALADAMSSTSSDPAIPSGTSVPSDSSITSATSAVAGAATGNSNVTVTVATPPTEFPNLIVTKALTVGKELKVSGKATFEGEVEIMADATFGKNVIIVGNLRIGGNLEVTGAVVTNLTAGASIAAGDPVAVNGSGQAVRAGGTNAVIGVATLSVAAGEQVKIAIAGKVGNMTGLTTGSRYFVSNAGVLTTDGQGGQGLGVAVSATEMLVQPGIGLPAAAVTPAPVKEEPAKEEVKPVETSTPVPPADGSTVTPALESVPTQVLDAVVPTVIPTLVPSISPSL